VRAAAEPGLRSVPEHALRFREIKKNNLGRDNAHGPFCTSASDFPDPLRRLGPVIDW
jgi:hypothetical protein